ncbi:LysR family transcriptional regulator [Xanthomonas sacchari]|uniref:LysR family transcriptional regulator n=1 Tax=Xanthomonas sacchari TaxID=56458 RepID=A0A2P5Z3M6_9XANT|nr:LysR family transcriptional regulator [Xanthomonas sacchari]MDV0436932.1 LysR family transcriptional regulator [Xanthomonas sacchari]PPU82330.1 LysR family transcriptional regulator [Xanthomonas sacchari]
MDRIGDIALFLRVLDLGSISAAARSLDLSVAVASQRLQRLERALGVRLLHRTTRRLHPTPEGLQLAEQGRPLVEDLESLAGGLRQAGASAAGTLRVTMSAAFGRLYVSPVLPRFMALHPQVRLSVHLSDNVVDLVSEGFDLAIRIGTLRDSSLVARRLAGNRRMLCASPDYLRRHGTPAMPADLAAHACLLLTGSDGRQDTWRLQGPDGEIAVRVAGPLETNFGEVLRDAAVNGQGIALHSEWHVAEDLRQGRLCQVLADYPLTETGIYAVMPQRRLVPPRVRAFVEFMQVELADPPPWARPG